MDYRFLAETLAFKPSLFQAMLLFNQDMAAPLPDELSALGEPFASLWNSPSFRRSWPDLPTERGYWNFSEESQRMALLPPSVVARLGLFLSAAVHAEELSRVIARDAVLELRRALGADIVSYALKRGRYQIGSLRNSLLVPSAFGSLPLRVKLLAVAAPSLISEVWPDELRRLAEPRFPRLTDETDAKRFEPALQREQRRALWFTMKKLLLREVAPEWAPCFD